ncbi:hypothetical protein OH77DRAFT_1403507 [Trametes cingulata]|nr:hypothetical protein OH77DRAFT_1403507 [Trametes cingulata]
MIHDGASPLTYAGYGLTLPTPPVSRTRDPDFFCQDIVFQVSRTSSALSHSYILPCKLEVVLSKVSRRPFEEKSEGFSAMITLPPSSQSSVREGTSDANPLRLHGIAVGDFKSLLYVLFLASYGGTRTLTKEQWMSALRLADMWAFDGVRDQAIRELRKLIPWHAERVRVAREFRIPGWIELAQQDALSAPELQALDWETAAKLFQARESMQFAAQCMCGCKYCSIAHSGVAGAPHMPAGTRPSVITAAALRRATDFRSRYLARSCSGHVGLDEVQP